jgi:hypothetical protein
MRISPTSEANEARAVDVKVTEEELRVDLEDGRTLVVPLAWYPRLVHGTPAERSQWRLVGRGHGIHWPVLDEDISVAGLVAGHRSAETQESLKRWLAARVPRRPNKRMQPSARRARRG